MLIRAVPLVECLGLCLDLQKILKDPRYACPLGAQNQSLVIPSLEQPGQLAPCAFMYGVGVCQEGQHCLLFYHLEIRKDTLHPFPAHCLKISDNYEKNSFEFIGILNLTRKVGKG